MEADVPCHEQSSTETENADAEPQHEEHKVSLLTEGLDHLLPLNLVRSPNAPTDFPARGEGPLPPDLPGNFVADRLQHVNAHTRDVNLRFDETTHTYFWKTRRVRESVTQVIHGYAAGFDADKTLQNMMEGAHWPRAGYLSITPPPDVRDKIGQLARGPRILAMLEQSDQDDGELDRELQEALQQAGPPHAAALRALAMPSDDVKRKWEAARDKAAKEGTWMHAQFECLLNGGTVKAMTPEISLLFKFLDSVRHATAYRTEWKIYADDIDVAGSIDLVLQQADGSLALVDWKRSSRIASRGEHFNRYMKPPLQHLGDSSLTHYHLQINMYRWILQRHYRKIVTEMYIVGTHPDNGQEPWVQQVELLDKEIADLVKDRSRVHDNVRDEHTD
ncbi:ASB8 [Symbiodinium sp. CCMP2592]|nr:ASB8 [Symbiodinium sp. CCMP2592]CAE7368196.1 ASB8 [Symbiodinium sp. CCMP2592]CAE7372620.1 ASB8 [Symbiodinium sp. CCMP2592]